MNISEKLTYYLLRFMSWKTHLFPRYLTIKFGRFLGYIIWLFFSIRKEVAFNNISIAFPDKSEKVRKEILKKTIEVNDPLRYKGIWFYQSSYGQSWSAIKGATFKVEDRQNKNKKKGKEVTFDFNKDFALPEWGLKVKMVDFVADFIYDTSAKKVFSRSAEHKNPAVLLEIYENGKLISKPWIFLNFPDAQFMKKKDSRYFFQLLNYNPVSYTGLQVTKDPGVNIVLVGFSLLTLGMILAFVVSHKKLWVSLEERDGKVIILTGGSVNKNDLGFEREFAGLTEDIEKQLKGNN